MADDEGRLPRRLSAILLADIKDYSAMMGEDEAHAIAGVDDIAAIFARIVPRHGGTFEITSGDRFFAVFESAVEAFEAGLEIQAALAATRTPVGNTFAIRIGMHLGEVVRTPFGLMGDSINVAARLEALATPGGIAVSRDFYHTVRNRAAGVTFRDLGPQRLKNIKDPVRVYAVQPGAAIAPDAGRAATPARTPSRPHPTAALARRVVLGGAIACVVGAAAWRWRNVPLEWIAAKPAGPRIAAGTSLVLGVMTVRTRGEVPDWMSDLTRDALNTLLSKQPTVLVYSRQKIDFLREARHMTEFEVAEQLGITKMIAATLSGRPSDLALEVQVVDIGTGLLEGSHEARGSEGQLIEMQNTAAIDVLHSLKVPVEPDLTQLLSRRTNDRLDAYKLLTESMGGQVETEPDGHEPRSGRSPADWLAPADAWADGDEGAIQSLLERYRAALEAEDLAAVHAVHVALPGPMHDALQKYFQNAERLRVRFSKVDVVLAGDEALATFTRIDDFTDAATGLPVHLEVRVSNVLTRREGSWKILGLKKAA